MKFENIDLIDALRRIMDIHTQNYKEDFDMDSKLIRELAVSESAADKSLLWMSRTNGTYLLREREVYVDGTYENKTWKYYHEQTSDSILAYHVEITGEKDGAVVGNLTELDYAAHVKRLADLTVTVEKVAVTFEDDSTYYLPFKSYRREMAHFEVEHGKVVSVAYLPESEQELSMILRREHFKNSFRTEVGDIDAHVRTLAVKHGKIAETLAPLPIAELRKYEEIKAANPQAFVCYAQNGYFELYGDDALKAAPLLGTKILEKKVHGKGYLAVTGFRESAWVAGSHKLWKTGSDVLLTKNGETFKDLKGADYIPVGATLMVDDMKCRIDAVDYAANEVKLTDITKPDKPFKFSEDIPYIRSFVEEAGIAIYDTIPKKENTRNSIREKLKTAQKSSKPQKQSPTKTKGKDMDR